MSLFTPGPTETMSATTSTSRVAARGPQLAIYNSGSVIVFVKAGGSSVEATTADYPIPAGETRGITVGSGVTHIAGITASGSATVYVTSGAGV